MAISRHLGFYRTTNRADPDNPNLEANMEWIGHTVCEIFAFKLYCDLETGLRGSLKVIENGTTYTVHTTLYSSSISNYASISYRFRDIAAYWSKIATPLVFGAPVEG